MDIEQALKVVRERLRECSNLPDDESCEWCDQDRVVLAEITGLRAKVMPKEVSLALGVLLNHVQPGWDNCKFVVEKWLAAALVDDGKGE